MSVTGLFPNAAQFDTMNDNLAAIARTVGANADLSTWGGRQATVRAGLGPQLMPVGTMFPVNHSVYGTTLSGVMGHDLFKTVRDPDEHTMTLLFMKAISSMAFDECEAFYYAAEALPAGTYNFTLPNAYGGWLAGTYQFTTTQTLPAGGVFTISDIQSTELTSCKVYAFSSRGETTKTEECTISAGSGGTSLGAWETTLNHPHRVSYGSGNFLESNIMTFLNSDAAAGSVFVPRTKYDRPAGWCANTAGFMAGLDADFLAAVSECIIPCAANNVFESQNSVCTVGQKYNFHAKFFLPSCKEIFNANYDVNDDSTVFPFFDGADAADRIRTLNGSAAYWWLRTANANGAGGARLVSPSGSVHSYGACLGYAVVPAFNI